MQLIMSKSIDVTTNHVEVNKCCIDLPWSSCQMVFLERDEIHGHKYSSGLPLQKSHQDIKYHMALSTTFSGVPLFHT